MDINVGHGGTSYIQKTKRLYSRLTFKGKIVFGIIGLIILYFILPNFSSSKDVIDNNNSNSKLDFHSRSRTINSVPNNQIHTLSDLLHYSPKVNSVSLSYLSLPPLVDSHNRFPHYKNGGNMLLSRNANYVRLVKDQPKQSGHLFSHIPISPDDLSAIEFEISFKIHGEQERLNLIGDGMAIWLTTEQLNQGDVFGMQSNFNGLGLFIDTYKNLNNKQNRHAFPYLSIQRNNGNENYYNKGNDGIDTQIGGCALNKIYNNGDNISKLRITYIRQANVFEIDVDINGSNEWRTCFRKENVLIDELLPVGRPLYLGVSAETGELHHIVDLYSINVQSFRYTDDSLITEIDSLGEGVKFSDNENDRSSDYSENINDATISRRRRERKSLNRLRRQEKKLKEMDKEKYGSEHGFVGWFFGLVWKFLKFVFYILLIIVAVYACVIGLRVYKEKQRKKNIGGLL
jgi:mannose-binding lectin 2